jgi:hypothetical protein
MWRETTELELRKDVTININNFFLTLNDLTYNYLQGCAWNSIENLNLITMLQIV